MSSCGLLETTGVESFYLQQPVKMNVPSLIVKENDCGTFAPNKRILVVSTSGSWFVRGTTDKNEAADGFHCSVC